MKCLINYCPNKYSVCCKSCECKEFCKYACKTEKPCMAEIPKRPTLKKKSYRWVLDSVLIALIVMLIVWLGNLNIMADDTLNTLNDQQQEINDLSKKMVNMEQLINEDIKLSETEENVALTAIEREYITRVCMAEAGKDPQGNIAVAQVIADRAELWDMTPLEVVTQKGQFVKPRQGELYEESVQAVWAVFDNNMRIFQENVTHFHGGEDKPYWTKGKRVIGNVGGNTFYR